MSRKFSIISRHLIVSAIIVVAGLSASPFIAKAATAIYLDMKEPVVYEGDSFLVSLKVNSTDKLINAIDASISYDQNKLSIKEISTGGSLFTLWPKLPTFFNQEGTMSFIGGATQGYKGEGGEVLKIVFLAKSEGETTISLLENSKLYLHDGAGTQINPWLRPLTINILSRIGAVIEKDEWQELVDKDQVAPEFIESSIGLDERLFDNQYFLSFLASDEESGIDHFEVKEEDFDFVRAESPYLLKDQSLRSKVQIKAVDKAGNEVITVPEKVPASRAYYWLWALGVLSALGLVYIFGYLLKVKLKNKRNGK